MSQRGGGGADQPRESFYMEGANAGRVFDSTRSGVHPEDDWGELKFVCTLVNDEVDDGLPFDLEGACRRAGHSYNSLMSLTDLRFPGERAVYITYFTYKRQLAATATFVKSPRDGVAAVFNVVGGDLCRDCHLPNLESLLFAAAARRLKLSFLFLATLRDEFQAGAAQLSALQDDNICPPPFGCFRDQDDAVFSPYSPHRHPWLSFGQKQDTRFEDRQVFMRTCVIQKHPSSDRHHDLKKMIFSGDNRPRPGVYEARYDPNTQQWTRRRPFAEYPVAPEVDDTCDSWEPCDPPNYAAACPNMFLSHLLDTNGKSLLYIIDGKLLGERLPLPAALPRPSRGVAAAMGLHRRLGRDSPLGGLDSDILATIQRLALRPHHTLQ